MAAHADSVDSTVQDTVEDPDVGDAKSFAKKVLREAKVEDLPMLAASLAYQAFVSLVPLLGLLFLAISVVGDQALAEQVLQFTQSFLPGPAQEMLRGYIVGQTSSDLAGVGVIGLVVLVWGAFKIFRGLDKAFSEIYDTEASNSIVDQFRDSAVVLLSLAVALVAAVAATTVFAVFQKIPFVGLLSPLVLAIGLAVAFTPIYYEFPDLDLSWKGVLPGVVVAAIGWTLLQAGFQVYLSMTGKTDPASVVGAALVLLTWLYFGSAVLLLGAVVNAVVVGERATGETYDPSSSEASGAESGSDDGADLDRERAELERTRHELESERRRLKYRRQAIERERRESDADADIAELQRSNRELARRVRWYEKPLWRRLLWRALGRTPETETRGNPETAG
jgi:membrane protein